MTEHSPAVDIYGVVGAHLQPTEVIKIATRCRSVQTPDADTYLAVISNVQNDHDAEQAALLAVEVRAGEPFGKISGILPIFSDYTFSIEQYDDTTSSNTPVLEAAGKPMQASFIVRFISNEGSSTLKAITDDIASLGDLMQETKRLADIAAKHEYTPNCVPPSHTWLAHYTVTTPDGHPRPYVVPRKQDSFSSMLASYGSKALEGLPPSLSSTLGSFSFLGKIPGAISQPPALPPRPRVQKLFQPKLDDETQSKLDARRSDFVTVEKLSVHIATFNANGQFYDVKYNLASWLKPEEQPDILVVGLQEMDLRPEVMMIRHDNTVGHAWVTGILACLNDGADGESKKGYQCLEMKQLAGMYIACFADSTLVKSGVIDDVTATSVMTGWAGFAGNKGACGIRLKVHDSRTLCFVSAHLAAFQDNVERRNADYKDICTRMVFPLSERIPSSKTGSDTFQTDEQFYPTIFDSDVLFFFGDLNYRLDLDMSECRSLLEKKAYKELLEHDQLRKAQTSTLPTGLIQSLAHAFEDFKEGEITFQPTYKYDKGTDNFDSSEKERKPAYTDIVLWFNGKGSDRENEGATSEKVKVVCKSYTSAMDLKMSDHKPVMAAFEIQLPSINMKRRHEIVEELIKESSKK